MRKYAHIGILCAATVLTGCIGHEDDGPDQNLLKRTVPVRLCKDNHPGGQSFRGEGAPAIAAVQ